MHATIDYFWHANCSEILRSIGGGTMSIYNSVHNIQDPSLRAYFSRFIDKSQTAVPQAAASQENQIKTDALPTIKKIGSPFADLPKIVPSTNASTTHTSVNESRYREGSTEHDLLKLNDYVQKYNALIDDGLNKHPGRKAAARVYEGAILGLNGSLKKSTSTEYDFAIKVNDKYKLNHNAIKSIAHTLDKNFSLFDQVA